jgi:antitoxin VapB
MNNIAKIFLNGRSQAVRLPAAFRFDCKEVYIKKDPTTGDVILSCKPESWEAFLQLAQTMKQISADFMSDREDLPPQERTFF